MAPATPLSFTIDIPDAVLTDLRERLMRIRWPHQLPGESWLFGADLGTMQALVGHWLEEYDWRAEEQAINAVPHYRVDIDGTPIHFIHVRGKGPNPIPLILTHGWPWTFWFYRKLIGPLADPVAHGGVADDAFDLIIPSLPGYGFSTPLRSAGLDFQAIARMWVTLMRDILGYSRFGAGGGDWGSLISAQLGHQFPEHLLGVHLTQAIPLDYLSNGLPPTEDYLPEEALSLEQTRRSAGQALVHKTMNGIEPLTLDYALNDSPAGLLAWLLFRLRGWSDCGGQVENRFSRDDILTTAMLYWVTQSSGSAGRLYAEARARPWSPVRPGLPFVQAPTAITLSPHDMLVPPRRWAERHYNLQQWKILPEGGHFGPMEQPDSIIAEIRPFFRPCRPAYEHQQA
jgi:pimeloyl-ACP methyl ester carboxylesterase